MKVVLQRVKYAKCTVENQVTGKIDFGYLLLVGFKTGDTAEILPKMVKKIANLRVFEDENGKMNKSLGDVKGGILSISQFTLYADLSGGNRPSFTHALQPDAAKALYLAFGTQLRSLGIPVEEGVFGAHMDLEFTNDGPVTIIIEF
ncbi:MAG TPA: D-tyrosyl-tRNA(Tyr) deacylase [Acholeplasmatales bacterium]|nr:D-tyrosyl-tRNA(Tyr) deacylase [Acholeplasmatales bacterium]